MITLEDVQSDGGRISVGRRARVFPGVGQADLAQEQRGGSHGIRLVRHDGHSAARRVVPQLLSKQAREPSLPLPVVTASDETKAACS